MAAPENPARFCLSFAIDQRDAHPARNELWDKVRATASADGQGAQSRPVGQHNKVRGVQEPEGAQERRRHQAVALDWYAGEDQWRMGLGFCRATLGNRRRSSTIPTQTPQRPSLKAAVFMTCRGFPLVNWTKVRLNMRACVAVHLPRPCHSSFPVNISLCPNRHYQARRRERCRRAPIKGLHIDSD